MAAASETMQQQGGQLLHQLGLGLASYRLYPGNVSQPAFASVAERIRQTAAEALAAGPIQAEVRSGRLQIDGVEVDNDRADLLADALFQRRIEHLRVIAPPSAHDLGALFDALVRDPDEVETDGGVGALLAARGVASLLATQGVPDPTSGSPDLDHELAAAAHDADGLADPEAALPDLAALPGETAQQLYDRLRAISDDLPEEVSARSSFFRRTAQLAAGFDERQRADFAALVLDRAASEAFAERFVGHLTDIELAAAITIVAATRRLDPASLAADVASATGRPEALIRLVELAVAHTEGTPRLDGASPSSSQSVGDVREDAESPEARLRAAFPSDPDQECRIGLQALRDYLLADPGVEQISQTMEAAAVQLRSDIRSLSAMRVTGLLETLDAVTPGAPPDVRELLRRPRREALSSDVLADVAQATVGEPHTAVAVLQPFGPAGVSALVEALAVEQRRAVRGLLLSLLVNVVDGDVRQLEPYLDDSRWFVARNVASALRRIGGLDAVPLFERLAAHPHQSVRREALHSLEGAPPEHAAPALARLALALEDRSERQACLQALASVHGPLAASLLAQLAERRSTPRLPWGLRRQARALARQGRGR
ncbi:MAG TPA: hypothetical protein VML96_01770 [Egibacteraceae bacterium]|nr:hypothetical protein [Egibacteraceae bacterium]